MKKNTFDKIVVVLLGVSVALGIYNSFQVSSLGGGVVSATGTGGTETTGVTTASVIPKGTPGIYGSELGVSFDDVTPYDRARADAAIAVLANLDRTLTVEGDDLQRYIDVASRISCEYCCSAKSIIFDDGRAACGCAHSYAMRGLAKYLVLDHGDEYSDDEILEELGKWKTLFFPSQITSKAQAFSEKGIELNYINLASNKYKGIEQGGAGGMVGGC